MLILIVAFTIAVTALVMTLEAAVIAGGIIREMLIVMEMILVVAMINFKIKGGEIALIVNYYFYAVLCYITAIAVGSYTIYGDTRKRSLLIK